MNKLNITLNKGQIIWFSSDQHFGHRNVINFCDRPYADVKEMNQSLIDNWNSVVSNNDIIFVLGDMFWFHGRHEIKKVVAKLNGKYIYVVPGNHCKRDTYELCDERLILIDDISSIYLRYEEFGPVIYEIFLSHCPMMTWPHRDRGAYNFFGHIHSGPKTKAEVDQDLPLWKGLQYDVGVDNNNYTPVSLEEIIKRLN